MSFRCAAQHTLENTKFGAMAGIGVLILLWTVIKLLGNIEISFNDIFGGVKCRSFGRKIIDYCAIIILLPFLLILSTTVTVFLESQANFIVEKLPFLALYPFEKSSIACQNHSGTLKVTTPTLFLISTPSIKC